MTLTTHTHKKKKALQGPGPSGSSGAQIAPQGWSYLEARRSVLCPPCSGTSAEVWGRGGTQPPLAKALPLRHPPDQPPDQGGGSLWP